jgi:hypothetical protein
MKIWGSTSKQRMRLFTIIATLWVSSFVWVYVTEPSYTSTLVLLASSVIMMLFYMYLIIDNLRSERTNLFIRQHLPALQEIASRFQFEFNDILCRSEIARIMKDSLDSGSSNKYNYEVIDKTNSKEIDEQKCVFHIYADGQFKESLIIVRTGVINNDFIKA